jgi:hypothetical protein
MTVRDADRLLPLSPIAVQGLEVQFEVSETATFGDGSTVTVPTAPDVEPLRYRADVIAAPGEEAVTERA